MQETYETKVPEDKAGYTTFVFKNDYAHQKGKEELRNILGPDYQGMTPVIWSVGNELEIGEAAIELLRKIRDCQCADVDEEVADFFESERVCYYS